MRNNQIPVVSRFSSLSESGFIPTKAFLWCLDETQLAVLISFREWLHSYLLVTQSNVKFAASSSHLFQRVASFLHKYSRQGNTRSVNKFSSLSESGFIPTRKLSWNSKKPLESSHLFQRVASFLHLIDTISVSIKRLGVLISFREWLHSYQQERCDGDISK